MHQHVQAQCFLLAHTAGHLGLHGLLVGGSIDLSRLELTTCLTNLGRLREGADGGGGKRRQLEAGPLALRPHRIGALACRCRLRGALGQCCLHGRVVDTRRTTTRLDRLPVGCQLVPHGITAFIDGPGQHTQLIQLLARKGQPRLQLGIQPVLAGQIHRYMQQRARRRQPQPPPQPRRHRLQPVQHRLQISLPDIATINDPQRQHLVRRQQVQQGLHVLAATDGVQMQPRHRQIRREPGILFQRPEIRGQQHLDAHALQVVIGQVQRMLPARRQFGHQNRLVDLHPLHPRIGQRLQQLGVHRQQPRQQ